MQSTARGLKRGNLKMLPTKQMQQVYDNETGTVIYKPVDVMRLHSKSKRRNKQWTQI